MKNLIRVVVLALAVAGCAQTQKFVNAVTTTITNPVTSTDTYRLKNTYAATLQLAVDYRAYCWSKPYASLVADPVAAPICKNRRAVVRHIQAAKAKASVSVRAADNFVKNNPTVNASVVVGAAWDAVKAFHAAVPVVK